MSQRTNQRNGDRAPSLMKTLFNDFKAVSITTLLLAIATFASAMAVVWSAHQTRMARAELEKLETQRDELDTDFRELRLAQAALSEHNRVDVIARQKLAMERVGTDNERVVIHE